MQIIYAHRKSFDADQYAAIKYNFSSFERNMATVCSFFLIEILYMVFDSMFLYMVFERRELWAYGKYPMLCILM
jgi:hypothetical protein